MLCTGSPCDLHHEIAAGEIGLVGRTAGLHAHDQDPGLLGEADGAAHPARHGRRRDGDSQARRQAPVGLEERQPGRHVLGQRAPWLAEQRRDQALGPLAIRGQCRPDELAARAR